MVVALPVHSDTIPGGAPLLRYPVEVAARYSNPMSFRVGGKLMERRVRLGDEVRKGQVLALLDPQDAERQLAAAQATLDAAEHRLVFARQQLQRDRAQAAQNLISTQQLEQTQDSFDTADAAQKQAAAQLVLARNALSYNTLLADHDGLITSENADTGQVLSPGQSVYGLAWSGDTDVVLDASSADVGQLAIGQAATISFPALPGQHFQARVREIAPAADPSTRTFRVKLSLTTPSEALRLGMSGEAALKPLTQPESVASHPTYTIPATALFHHGEAPAVWVIGADSRLSLRPVQVVRHGATSTVVSAGIADGDVIVVAGVHAVHAGESVRPVRPLFDEQGEVLGPQQETAVAELANSAGGRR